mmetsp:Transcript_9624/g.21389  ORF Transcript_9624/g.21389 Transcript_9624/m.21389 type:complete len:297 (-) Transcript_9624:682-1572(-)
MSCRSRAARSSSARSLSFASSSASPFSATARSSAASRASRPRCSSRAASSKRLLSASVLSWTNRSMFPSARATFSRILRSSFSTSPTSWVLSMSWPERTSDSLRLVTSRSSRFSRPSWIDEISFFMASSRLGHEFLLRWRSVSSSRTSACSARSSSSDIRQASTSSRALVVRSRIVACSPPSFCSSLRISTSSLSYFGISACFSAMRRSISVRLSNSSFRSLSRSATCSSTVNSLELSFFLKSSVSASRSLLAFSASRYSVRNFSSTPVCVSSTLSALVRRSSSLRISSASASCSR